MAKRTSADALLAQVQPLVERFARELAEMQAKHMAEATERVMGEAMEKFQSLLALPEEGTAPRKARTPRSSPNGPRKPTCSNCGEPGHNARSCAQDEEEDEEENEAPPAKRVDHAAQASADRYAKIEASAARRNGASHG